MITDGSTFAATITDLLTDAAGGFLPGVRLGCCCLGMEEPREYLAAALASGWAVEPGPREAQLDGPTQKSNAGNIDAFL
jgi:hypothetical protein